MQVASRENRKEQDNLDTFIIDMLKPLGVIGLSATCELPYLLINKIGNLLGLDNPVYFNKEGDWRYRPSRVQRYLRLKSAEYNKTLSDRFIERGDMARAERAAIGAQIDKNIAAKFDESIKAHKWYEISLW